MSAPKVEKEEVLTALKEFPPITGRLNARNIHAAHKHLIDVAERFPSDQAPEFGHRGLVEPAELYSLVAPNRPWISPTNPGPHRPLGLASAAERSDPCRRSNRRPTEGIRFVIKRTPRGHCMVECYHTPGI